MGGNQSKQTPLVFMVKNFMKGHSGNYDKKLFPLKHWMFCEIDWPAFGGGSLDIELISRVFRIVAGDPGEQDQLPYLDSWQDTFLSQPPWLRDCLEENCKVMLAQITDSSKCPKEFKKAVLSGEAEEILPRYAPLYPLLPPAAPNSQAVPGEAVSLDWLIPRSASLDSLMT